MKILIAYAGRAGVAKECAELLKKELCGRDVTLCDLKKEKPIIEDYDAVVVGSAIYFGNAEKTVRNFLKENAKELENKKFGGFVCCAFSDMSDKYIEETFSAELRRKAVDCAYFGGELKPDKQKKFFYKMLVKMMRNEIINNGDSDDESEVRILPEINPSEIVKFADKLKKS